MATPALLRTAVPTSCQTPATFLLNVTVPVGVPLAVVGATKATRASFALPVLLGLAVELSVVVVASEPAWTVWPGDREVDEAPKLLSPL